jgi:ubiquinone/menaquinone biosynthesis C-methylase UbiE
VDHADHVALIRAGVEDRPGRWVDLGSGTGAFTLALADVLGDRGAIVSVDRDAGSLAEQRRRMVAAFPSAEVRYVQADFTGDLEIGVVDGILMANSLHFIIDKEPVLRSLLGHLRPGGRFLLVEYDTDHGNPWVPHPISYGSWQRMAPGVGLAGTHMIGRVPSRFLGAIYSAVSESSVTAQTGSGLKSVGTSEGLWSTRPMKARVDLDDKETVRRLLDEE